MFYAGKWKSKDNEIIEILPNGERRVRFKATPAKDTPQAMEELCRNLQAVRDWCARTQKPTLRRALVAEANRIMRRMQRFATVTPVELPDLVLH